MKKTLSTVLIGSMLLMPIPVLATDDDNNLHSLSFEKIEEEMEARSPLILDAGDKVADASSDLSKAEDGLKTAIDLLNAQKTTFTTTITALTAKTTDPSLSDSDKELYTSMIGLYQYLLGDLQMNLTNTEKQLDSIDDQQGDLWKSWLQVEQGKNQAIWGAQQLYLSYFNLEKTRDNIQTNLTLLQKKLTALQLKESLGLATHIETLGTESQIKELSLTLDSLKEGLEALEGQMNVMLGQDFDTELKFSEPSSVSRSKLSAMDYEEDLDEALDQSYSVRLQEESDQREDAERNFTLAFHKAYQNVQDKEKAVELERYKLSNEQLKYDQAVLMNSLGLTSNLDFEGLRSLYLTQVNKVKTAEQDVLQAYTAYDWMKKGLTVSTGASASGASSSSSSASSSQASGAAPSGMGF